VLHGHTAVADLLAAAGARPSQPSTVDEFVAACLRGDRATVARLSAADPDLADRVRAAQPNLLWQAAGYGRLGAVRLLVASGYDVNPGGGWPTPLHLAAAEGHLDVVTALLEAGADPTARATVLKTGDPAASIEDPTPLGWAHHHGQTDVAAYLAGDVR
jgi:Ankyrin repeats (3 copies)